MKLRRGVALGAAAVSAAAAGALLLRRPRTAPRREPRVFLPPPPHVIAHRGGAALAPENTMPAFEQAVHRWGVDAIELDVRASRDGHCVVIHDPTVDRTTDGTGRVADLDLRELQALDAGYAFTTDGGATFPFRGQGVRIPTFDEVLHALPDARFIVEVKIGTAQVPLFEAVRKAGAEGRVMAAGERTADRTMFAEYPGPLSASGVHCRNLYLLHRLRLGSVWGPPVDAVQIPERWAGRQVVSPRLIRDLHVLGILVHIWTVNEEADMRRLLDWGVDGLVTDRPDLLLRVLGRPPAE